MIFIWGSKGRVRTINRGTFNCPHCGGQRPYERKKAQRWFTLYFIPVFPMETLGEHIVCEACSNAYAPAVLEYDPTMERAARESHLQNLWRSAMIAIACAFGVPDEAQAQAIGEAMERIWKIEPDVSSIIEDCRNVPVGGVELERIIDRLPELAANLTLKGKEDFLALAQDVLQAGAAERERQQDVLRGIGTALGLSEAHVRGIVAVPA